MTGIVYGFLAGVAVGVYVLVAIGTYVLLRVAPDAGLADEVPRGEALVAGVLWPGLVPIVVRELL